MKPVPLLMGWPASAAQDHSAQAVQNRFEPARLAVAAGPFCATVGVEFDSISKQRVVAT
jgi:hypothetical protein